MPPPLPEATAREVRRRALDGERHKVIARDLNVSIYTVTRIKTGRRWPSLAAEEETPESKRGRLRIADPVCRDV